MKSNHVANKNDVNILSEKSDKSASSNSELVSISTGPGFFQSVSNEEAHEPTPVVNAEADIPYAFRAPNSNSNKENIFYAITSKRK